ncbi:MAG: hypothetical protein Q8L49_08980 [Burkholderiaceae bacterium]|nr:hypothetical protein [Burkholderiaceae bacterium]
MTSKSPRKPVEALFWQGRLRTAKAYLEAAQQAVLLAEPAQNGNPIISQIVLAAIAYGDSLTARRAMIINQQDHAAAPRLLRDVLQNTLPDAQERRYRRILGFKDEAQYGARTASIEEASRLLADLEGFARWAEDLL